MGRGEAIFLGLEKRGEFGFVELAIVIEVMFFQDLCG